MFLEFKNVLDSEIVNYYFLNKLSKKPNFTLMKLKIKIFLLNTTFFKMTKQIRI